MLGLQFDTIIMLVITFPSQICSFVFFVKIIVAVVCSKVQSGYHWNGGVMIVKLIQDIIGVVE